MKTISRIFAGKTAKSSAAANAKLRDAYSAFLRGTPAVEDVELILTDLGTFTGFTQITDPSESEAQARFNEGQRSVMARILTLGGAPAEVQLALAEAVMAENLALQQEQVNA